MSNHTDPICGMSLSPETAVANAVRDGEVYYFCSRECMETFKQSAAGNAVDKSPVELEKTSAKKEKSKK